MYHSPEWWFSSPLIVGWGLIVILFAIWSLYWKGRSLWKAARLGHLGWFIALLIINTAGILDILYIYVFSKPKMTSPGKSSDTNGNHDHSHHNHDHSNASKPEHFSYHHSPGEPAKPYHLGPADQKPTPTDQNS